MAHTERPRQTSGEADPAPTDLGRRTPCVGAEHAPQKSSSVRWIDEQSSEARRPPHKNILT